MILNASETESWLRGDEVPFATTEQSATDMLAIIDKATREVEGGHFMDVDGESLAWQLCSPAGDPVYIGNHGRGPEALQMYCMSCLHALPKITWPLWPVRPIAARRLDTPAEQPTPASGLW